VSFGNQLGYIALTCIIGTITGVTFGTCVAAVVKRSEGLKIGILIGLSMTMSFLSGMMYDKMKYIVATKLPVLGYLNPSNLITDSFYSLYYYDTHTRFFTNIIILCFFAVGFSLITYLVLRRQKYASL
jgi:ABC-2 type transport system permease protein